MNKLQYPVLNLNELICRKNISGMVNKAKKHNLMFRPHFKTHQSAEVGSWFKEEGVRTITVSSVAMADYFAKAGWKDILIAFPLHSAQIVGLNALAEKVQISILVSSKAAVNELGKISKNIVCYVELDFGSERTGFIPEDVDDIRNTIDRISTHDLKFGGFYTHPGHTYSLQGKTEVGEIYHSIFNRYEILKNKLSNYSVDEFICGDTPGSSLTDEFGPITDISPGNFVFYDVMQHLIGSCRFEDIALHVECPVVAKRGKDEVVIHGGAVHFSKDSAKTGDNSIYGWVLDPDSPTEERKVLSGTYLNRLSQEHGVIRSENMKWFSNVSEGDLVRILPIHSCLTSNLFPKYQCGSRIIDKMQSF